jgi:hypothetical protein
MRKSSVAMGLISGSFMKMENPQAASSNAVMTPPWITPVFGSPTKKSL